MMKSAKLQTIIVMKITSILFLVPILTSQGWAQSNCCPERGVSKRIFRDAATHESIAGQSEPVADPIARFKLVEPLTPIDEADVAKRVSIVSRSEIIHRGPLVTLIPKRSVLHLPDGLRGVKGKVLGKKLVNWGEFYKANRSWIDTVEVTRAQAEGREPLSDELTKSFEKRTKAVVAVLQGGPISVLPVEVPELEIAEAQTKNQP